MVILRRFIAVAVGLLMAGWGLRAFASGNQPRPATGPIELGSLLSPPLAGPGWPRLALALADSTPPTGSISINEGARFTRSPQVTLSLIAVDMESGVDLMQFSPDNVRWTDPEPFSSKKDWTLEGDDGVHWVYVRFRDKAGNWTTEPLRASVVLDRLPPANPTLTIDGGARYATRNRVMLQLSATDAREMLISQSSDFSGTLWMDFNPTLSWTLSLPDGPKTLYAKFRDEAGNETALVSSSIILDTTPPTHARILINGGASFTKTSTVHLTLAAEEATEMLVSNDPAFAGASWMPLADSLSWTLPWGDGEKNIFAKFRDAAGNETATLKAVITLDTVPPTNTSLTINGGAPYTNNTSVKLNLLALGASEMFIDGDVVENAETRKWIPYSAALATTLVKGDTLKTITALFRDPAGNVSEPVESTITLDSTPPTLSNLSIEKVTPNQVTLSWVTSEPTDGEIDYGTTTAYEASPLLDHAWMDHHTLFVPGLAAGTTYHFRVTCRDRAGNTATSTDLTATTLSDAIIRGFAYFEETRIPVEKASVTLGALTTSTDSIGYFEFRNPPMGTFTLSITKEKFEPTQTSVAVPVTGAVDRFIELSSTALTGTVSGTVSGLAGDPLPEARVTLLNPDGSESEITAVTTIDGRYQLPKVPAGMRYLRVQKDFYDLIDEVIAVEPPSLTQDVTLHASLLPPPTGLGAVPATLRSIHLEWLPPSGPTLKGYNLYRAGATSEDFQRVNAVLLPPQTRSHTDSGLTIGATYRYRITTVNRDDGEGKPSFPVTASTYSLWTLNANFGISVQGVFWYASPTLGDLDGDGDLDLVLGAGDGAIRAYENVGSRSGVIWQPRSTFGEGIAEAATNATLALGDLDGDGDLDLLRGRGDGTVKAYENVGTATAPRWRINPDWAVGLATVTAMAAPTLGDLDGDGDLDLLIGAEDGRLRAYENLSQAAAVRWQPNERFVATVGRVGDQAHPALGDLDRDGDLDLLVGDEYGLLWAFENRGTKTSPSWVANPEYVTGTFDVGNNAAPALGDLDGDGDLDLLLGSWVGAVNGFENNLHVSPRVIVEKKSN